MASGANKRNRIIVSMPSQFTSKDLRKILNDSDGKVQMKRISIALNEAQANKLAAIKKEMGHETLSKSSLCTAVVIDHLLKQRDAQFEDLTNIPQKFMPIFERLFSDLKRLLESSKR